MWGSERQHHVFKVPFYFASFSPFYLVRSYIRNYHHTVAFNMIAFQFIIMLNVLGQKNLQFYVSTMWAELVQIKYNPDLWMNLQIWKDSKKIEMLINLWLFLGPFNDEFFFFRSSFFPQKHFLEPATFLSLMSVNILL